MAQLDGIPLREYISAYPANMTHTSKTALSSVVQKPRNQRHQDDQEKTSENDSRDHFFKTQFHGISLKIRLSVRATSRRLRI